METRERRRRADFSAATSQRAACSIEFYSKSFEPVKRVRMLYRNEFNSKTYQLLFLAQ